MDFEKELFQQAQVNSNADPYVMNECILVDKVFDSCYSKECEPSKVVELPGSNYAEPVMSYKEGIIKPGTLSITPIRTDFARVRFILQVPFTLCVTNQTTGDKIDITDHIEFSKDMEMYYPDTPDEFSFGIVIETRSETLGDIEMVDSRCIMSIGTFAIYKIVGNVQLVVESPGYCPSPRRCTDISPEDVCEAFERRPLPDFFPEQLEDIDLEA